MCALWAGNLISSSANLFMFLARGRQVDEDLLVNFVSFYTWYYLDHVHGFSCQCAPTWYMQCTRTRTVEVNIFFMLRISVLHYHKPLKVKFIPKIDILPYYFKWWYNLECFDPLQTRFWCLCTVNFRQKGPKFNSSPVYYFQLYIIYRRRAIITRSWLQTALEY